MSLSLWHIQIYAGCIIGALSFGWLVYKRTNIVGGLLMFYLLLNSIHTYFLPKFNVPQMGPVTAGMIPALSAMSMIWIIMLCVPFLLIPNNKLHMVNKFFWIIALLESVSIIFKLGQDQFKNSALLLNPAQDGAFVSCLLPLVYEKKKWFKWPLIALMVTAIIMTQATTPFVGLGVFIATLIWFSRYRILTVLGPLLVASLGVYFQGYNNFKADSGRLYIWPLAMNYWNAHLDKIIGAGSGSFFIYGPTIELTLHGFGYNQPVYVWMHNEWLQVLFEFGIIGLLLALAFYFFSLKKSYVRPSLFSSLLIYGATACFQMPLRQMISALFLVFLLRITYREAYGS